MRSDYQLLLMKHKHQSIKVKRDEHKHLPEHSMMQESSDSNQSKMNELGKG